MPFATVVSDGLYGISVPLGDRFAALYLAVGSSSALLYDTGIDGTIPQAVIPALAELGLEAGDVSAVVVSHCDVDHFGGVADARERFPRATVVAHQSDRAAIEDYETYLRERGRSFLEVYGWDEDLAVLEWCRSVTREAPLTGTVHDGDVYNLGDRRVEVWHVPGHSRGHTAINVPWADAVLVSDAVLGSSVNLADGSPAFPPTYRHVDDYLATIDRLAAAGHHRLVTAHYPLFVGDEARDFLDRSRAFVDRLDGLVLAALRNSAGLTLAELLAAINPQAGDWPSEGTQGALAFPVVGHLERFVDAGTIRLTGHREGVAVWGVA